MNPTDCAAIASDLDRCDIIEVIGTRTMKRQARKHRRAIFAAIRAENIKDGVDNLTDDELLAALAE